jgi:hypothetical protein
MIKYWIRLHEDKTNCMLKAAGDENNKMHNNGCWNINLNLQYVRNLFSFLLVAGFYLTKLIFSLQSFVYLSFNFVLIIFISLVYKTG